MSTRNCLARQRMVFLLLLTLTLGVADAGNLLEGFQQQEHLPPADGLLDEVQQQEQLPPANVLLCPDQASKCRNSATCCQLSSGQWGCCPFAQATCCGDNVHCCPNGFTCNHAKEQCVRAITNETTPWASKESTEVSASSSSSAEEAISPSNGYLCPNRVSACPVHAACCRTQSGSYRCCQYPYNVCCSNGYHCCSRCTICDWLGFKCISGIETKEWETVTESIPASLPTEINDSDFDSDSGMTEAAEKVPAMVVDESDIGSMALNPYEYVRCDRRHYCRNGQTCCRHRYWKWGCCPLRRANCCSGMKYCCPYHKRCSCPEGRCHR